VEENETVETNGSEPIVHQFGKLVVGTIIGFVAQQLAVKGYDVALAAYRNRNS